MQSYSITTKRGFLYLNKEDRKKVIEELKESSTLASIRAETLHETDSLVGIYFMTEDMYVNYISSGGSWAYLPVEELLKTFGV